MSGGWFIGSRHSNARSYGTVAGSTTMTLVTGGAANTKGSYVQLTASTAGDCSAIIVHGPRYAGAGDSASADIAIGGAGSEQIIIPDILTDTALSSPEATFWPIAIPTGTRIAARTQGVDASGPSRLAVTLLGDGVMGRSGGVVDAIGFVAASTLGTNIDPGGSANTKGSYAQIVASTSNRYSTFRFHLDLRGSASTHTANTQFVDIAIGGAGSEIIIVPDFPFQITSFPDIFPYWSPWFDIEIPANSRVAVRSQSSTTTSASRQWGFVMYALRA